MKTYENAVLRSPLRATSELVIAGNVNCYKNQRNNQSINQSKHISIAPYVASESLSIAILEIGFILQISIGV